MPLSSPTTAEHVMAAVEATVANGGQATADLVADFLETSSARAGAALSLAADLGLLVLDGTVYRAISPLCRFTTVPDQKAAVLRIVIEGYHPFAVFRERMVATTDVSLAARHTKAICRLPADRDAIKDTMISLGTFSHAFVTEGGGNYELEAGSTENTLRKLALACTERVSAEARVRSQLGPAAEATVSRENVILPLADALIRAKNRDASGAVQAAGNAVESHIDATADRMRVALGTATGIMSKLSKFAAAPRHLPSKLIHLGSYLGAIRNAADHGGDPDIGGTQWQVREATALEYVYVACSFIAATVGFEKGDPPEI